MIRLAAIALTLGASVASADGVAEFEDHIVCGSEKQVVNQLVRLCGAASDTAVATMVDRWRTHGQLDTVEAQLAQQGRTLEDLKVQPYSCLIPTELQAASEDLRGDVRQAIGDRTRAAIAALDITAAELTEDEACAAIDLALSGKGDLARHFKEYGIE